MGLVKIDFDVNALEARLKQVGDRAVRGGLDEMREEAQEIRDRAVEFAPIKSGTLHRAIKVDEEGGGRGAGGRFSRKEVVIFVDNSEDWRDPDELADSGGWPLELYAYFMHEGLGPFGNYEWGRQGLNVPWRKKSLEHDGGRGVVGGKFLKRAYEEREKPLMRRLAFLYQRMFQK
jgi:hypothetical protein